MQGKLKEKGELWSQQSLYVTKDKVRVIVSRYQLPVNHRLDSESFGSNRSRSTVSAVTPPFPSAGVGVTFVILAALGSLISEVNSHDPIYGWRGSTRPRLDVPRRNLVTK